MVQAQEMLLQFQDRRVPKSSGRVAWPGYRCSELLRGMRGFPRLSQLGCMPHSIWHLKHDMVSPAVRGVCTCVILLLSLFDDAG